MSDGNVLHNPADPGNKIDDMRERKLGTSIWCNLDYPDSLGDKKKVQIIKSLDNRKCVSNVFFGY